MPLKEKRLRDKKYLASYKDAPCLVCELIGIRADTMDVVGAHIRTGHSGGMGLKPDDNLTLPLCYFHHMDQEDNPGAGWWVANIVAPMARKRYRDWKAA